MTISPLSTSRRGGGTATVTQTGNGQTAGVTQEVFEIATASVNQMGSPGNNATIHQQPGKFTATIVPTGSIATIT